MRSVARRVAVRRHTSYVPAALARETRGARGISRLPPLAYSTLHHAAYRSPADPCGAQGAPAAAAFLFFFCFCCFCCFCAFSMRQLSQLRVSTCERLRSSALCFNWFQRTEGKPNCFSIPEGVFFFSFSLAPNEMFSPLWDQRGVPT